MIKEYPYALVKMVYGLHSPNIVSTEVEFMEILYNVAIAEKCRSALQIGNAFGHSAWWLDQAMFRTGGKLISIDVFMEGLLESQFPNTKCVNLSSDQFFRSNTTSFDFVFIDGDHSYEQCKKDMVNSLECLFKGGGVIALHDTVFLKESVGLVVDEFQDVGLWTHYPFGKGLSYVRIER